MQQRLGAGGFGTVYQAIDKRQGRVVALKVPHVDLKNTRLVLRFLGEARAAALLRHPNIVPVYESGKLDGQLYIASHFVEGEVLEDRVATGPIEPREAARIARELALAFAYAHSEGVIHRDIKPANILLDKQRAPQISGSRNRQATGRAIESDH